VMCTHFTFYAKIFTVGGNLSDKVLTKIILLSFLRHGVEASSEHGDITTMRAAPVKPINSTVYDLHRSPIQ